MKYFKKIILSMTCILFVTSCSNSNQKENISAKNTNNNDVSLTVSCYNPMYKTFLDKAATIYMDKNPGTKIIIKTISTMPQSKTVVSGSSTIQITDAQDSQSGDYISNLSTSLISNDGPDIIAADVVPYYKYINSGQIANLGDLMKNDKDFNINDYNSNIFDATKFKGNNYILPIDYTYNYAALNPKLFNEAQLNSLKSKKSISYEDMVNLAKDNYNRLNDKSYYIFNLYGGTDVVPSMFYELLDEHYKDFVDLENNKVNFDSGKFADMLNEIKDYEEKGYIMTPIADSQNADSDLATPKDLSKYFYKTDNAFTLVNIFNKNKNNTTSSNSQEENINKDDIIGPLQNDVGQTNFSYLQAYMINENSTKKEAAWKFLKFLVSFDMQTSFELFGQPVNLKACKEKEKLQITGQYYNSDSTSGSEKVSDKQQADLSEYSDIMYKYSSILNSYNIRDQFIDDAITSESKNFFNGSKSAQEVGKILQDKITLYLNE